MARLASCPQDYATPMGSLSPEAVVLHRTYGYWPGDYAVIRNNSLCQFLIGKDPGNWVQFMDSTAVAYHCNGANFRAVGIELEGTNDDPLTDWQAARLGDVLRFLSAEHGIPLDFLDPNSVPAASVSVNHSGFRGVICHVSVATDDGSSQHSDEVSVADFQRALGTPAPTPTPTPLVLQEDAMLYVATSDGQKGRVQNGDVILTDNLSVTKVPSVNFVHNVGLATLPGDLIEAIWADKDRSRGYTS